MAESFTLQRSIVGLCLSALLHPLDQFSPPASRSLPSIRSSARPPSAINIPSNKWGLFPSAPKAHPQPRQTLPKPQLYKSPHHKHFFSESVHIKVGATT